MPGESSKLVSSMLYSLVVHITVVGLTLSSFSWNYEADTQIKVIQSTLLDEKQVRKEIEKYKREKTKVERDKQKRLRELERAAREVERKKAQLEKQRLEEELASKRRAEDLIKKQQEEKQRLTDLQKQREELEHKKKEEEDRLAQLELARKIEEEKQKVLKEEEEKKKEKQKLAEKDLLALLDAEQQSMQDEQLQRSITSQLSRAKDKWVSDITNRIKRHWNKPANLPGDYECRVIITQNRVGMVLKVRSKPCRIGKLSSVAIDSMEKAVYKAEPLPKAPEPEIFESEIIVLFKSKKEP